MSSTATVSAESSIRSLIFGDATRSRAELVRSLGLSRQGRMAAASPGPGFPHALELMWEQMTPPPAMRIADLGAGLASSIPQWTLVKHCVLEQEERSPLWRDVSIAVEIALQSFDRSNALSALRTDREELQRPYRSATGADSTHPLFVERRPGRGEGSMRAPYLRCPTWPEDEVRPQWSLKPATEGGLATSSSFLWAWWEFFRPLPPRPCVCPYLRSWGQIPSSCCRPGSLKWP
jgi:hypothetical protein